MRGSAWPRASWRAAPSRSDSVAYEWRRLCGVTRQEGQQRGRGVSPARRRAGSPDDVRWRRHPGSVMGQRAPPPPQGHCPSQTARHPASAVDGRGLTARVRSSGCLRHERQQLPCAVSDRSRGAAGPEETSVTQVGHGARIGGPRGCSPGDSTKRRDPFMTHAAETGVMKGFKRAVRRLLQTFSREPDRRVELRFCVERVTGIEPAWPAWKAGALPLSYTRGVPAQRSGSGR